MQWFVTIRLFEMVVIHWSRLQIYGIGIVGLLIFVFLSVYLSSREDHNCFCTLEEELQKSRVQISKLQEELQKSKVQISELQHQVHSHETRYQVVAREYRELCSEEGPLKAQIKDLQQKLDAKCVVNKIMWNAGGE
jgi:septal ring factor EnvC (AmiA/AmiB activator)